MSQKLFDVFPVGVVEFPGEEGQTRQEDQNPKAHGFAGGLRWLTHPLQIIDQVTNGLVVLRRCHGALHFP